MACSVDSGQPNTGSSGSGPAAAAEPNRSAKREPEP